MTNDQQPPTPGGLEDRGFFGHPMGLNVLFFSELWERFSFYGMRALLTLYMVYKLGYPEDPKAYGIYGAYAALVYAFPVVGGWLANKWLGYRRSIILGAVFMALGHFAMALEPLFFTALALLCLGNGFFKPNISSTVGRLYADDDPRRDRGFTIFYMGINIGALTAPLVCGTLGESISWHLGFSIAGLGMVIGLVWFLLGQKNIGTHGEPDDLALLKRPVILGLNRFHLVILASFAMVPLVALTLREYYVANYIIQAVSVIVLICLIVFTIQLDRVGRHRMIALIILMVFHMLFWAGFEQAGTSFNVMTKEHVQRSIFGWDVEASNFQAVNPTFIVLLAPFFSLLWHKLQDFGWDPSIPMKFALGLIQLALGYLVLVIGIAAADSIVTISLAVLVFCYLLHTTGELCLSPVGLSAVTKLAPKKWVGFCMGAWFLTIANAHLVSAAIAQLTKAGKSDETLVEVTLSEEQQNTVLEQLRAQKSVTEVVTATDADREMILSMPKARALILEPMKTPNGNTEEDKAKVVKTAAEVRQFHSLEPGTLVAWPETHRVIQQEVTKGKSTEIEALTQEVGARFGVESATIMEWRKESMEQYADVFWQVFYFGLASGVLLMLLTPLIKKLMHGIN